MTETFHVAKQAGDAKFLRWIHDRLEFVHGENPDVDYMHRLRDFVAWFEGDPLKGAEGERDEAIKDRDNSLKIANMNHAQWERAGRERDAAVAALKEAELKAAKPKLPLCWGCEGNPSGENDPCDVCGLRGGRHYA